MEHDLAGLDAALARQAPLESALTELCLFSNRYKQDLTLKQQEMLRQAIHCVACLFNDMLGGSSDDD